MVISRFSFFRMIRIIDGDAQRVSKDGARFSKRYAMLQKVASCLVRVPLKLDHGSSPPVLASLAPTDRLDDQLDSLGPVPSLAESVPSPQEVPQPTTSSKPARAWAAEVGGTGGAEPAGQRTGPLCCTMVKNPGRRRCLWPSSSSRSWAWTGRTSGTWCSTRFGELSQWAGERFDRADIDTLDRPSRRLLDAKRLEDVFDDAPE